ncbi:MAG: short-chain fatty acid transporter [Heyndrickxia sp.]
MQSITNFFTKLMRKYLPEPFVFSIALTILAMILAMVVQGRSFMETTTDWGNGFWNLLAFTTQMVVILAMGYVLAKAPIVDKLLDKIVGKVKSPKAAVRVATLAGAIGCYFNWGFGLIVGGIIAKKLALKVKGVHYPLIVAAGFSGFTITGLGISGTIPALISTHDHPMVKEIGIIPFSHTIFTWPMMITSLVMFITLPLLNGMLHPKQKEDVIEIDTSLEEAQKQVAATVMPIDHTFANKLNNSRILSLLIGFIGIFYILFYFIKGGSIDLNLVNFIFLFLGIILLGTPRNYVANLNEGIKTVSGLVLQFPFYAGIMAIMAGSGLVDTIANVFIKFSTVHTLPFWGLVSSFIINFFAPSAGGHWAIQGPFMIHAAKELGAPISKVAMSVQMGAAWNDLIQPFWVLPALALSKLKLKDIMGYCVMMMFWAGIVYISAFIIWGFMS